MRRCGAWSRSSGNDGGAVWKRAVSPLNLGRANVFPMIRTGIYRLLTSCGWGVGASQRRNARQLPISGINAVYNADRKFIDDCIGATFRVEERRRGQPKPMRRVIDPRKPLGVDPPSIPAVAPRNDLHAATYKST